MSAEPVSGGRGTHVATTGASISAPGSAGKRCCDLVGAALLLLLALPLLLAAACAIALTSRGPVLFRQERLGLGGQRFVMLKLRTMRAGCSDEVHRAYVRRLLDGQERPVRGLYKLERDPRVTRAGAWLRRTSIDELPQLWNVLRGEMSLVGPRPALAWEAELFPSWARHRFDVRPGLTGLWQVSGRNRLTMSQGLVLDLRYVRDRSLVMDLAILLRTFGTVLGRGTR